MRKKRCLVLVSLFLAMGLVVSAASPRAGNIPPGDFAQWSTTAVSTAMVPLNTMVRPSKVNPKLESSLNQLFEVGMSKGMAEAKSFAESRTMVLRDDRVQVVIVTREEKVADVVHAVEAAGGEYQAHYRNLVRALVPIGELEALSGRSDVQVIREPRRPIPQPARPQLGRAQEAEPQEAQPQAAMPPVPMVGSRTTQGVAASNASAWHAAGYTGAGVRVAVIDGGFIGYSALLGSDLPGTISTYDWTGTGIGTDIEHGTACAEIVYDMAYGATMDLHKVGDDIDLGNAVIQAISDGADIITMSLGWIQDGPGDGTGNLASIVNDARSNGVFYATAAGNNAEHCWSGTFADDGDGNHLWATDQNINYFGPGDGSAYNIPAGYPIVVALHWDDWTVVDQDYDMELYYWTGSAWQYVTGSYNDQAGSYPTPEEFIGVYAPATGPYGIVVYIWSATRNVCLRLVASHAGPDLDERVSQRSLIFPADSPDAITVGAVDVSSPYPLEDYSSRGPTFGAGGACSGGSTKPDIAGYANVDTVSYGLGGFNGTSAATPHVAGAAALVKEANPAYTVAQVQNYLEANALDLGSAGKDNSYGSGRLYLGNPPAAVVGWELWEDAPFVSMDTVVIAYKGLIYFVGGLGANGQVGIYDPITRSWTTGATEPFPYIDFPVDGALGLNGAGEPVIVLFPDAEGIVSGVLHRYNIKTDTWDTPAVPAGFPANGQWAHDIVSLLPITGENICYISGGATAPGGGNLNTLWEYHPDTNTITNLGNFTHHPAGFNFHASWYVPWIGTSGAICVGCGVDASSVSFPDTQCYDIAADTFNAPNADLGTMPEGVWGTADFQLIQGDGDDYQLWVANGADVAFALWPRSMYYSSLDGGWYYGPDMVQSTYRLEGDTGTLFGIGYAMGGDVGGFNATSFNQVKTPEYPEAVTLYTPNGGTLPSGSTHTILWGAPSDAVTFNLKYSLDNGATWKPIDSGITGRRYVWDVPVSKKDKKKCLVKVVGYNSGGSKVGVDRSYSPFKIEVVRVTSPNGGETLTGGGLHTITWQTNVTKNPVETVKLKYTKNGGTTWLPIDTLTGGDPGTYVWTVPGVPKTKSKCKVKVVLKDAAGKTVGTDTSDGYFTTEPATP